MRKRKQDTLPPTKSREKKEVGGPEKPETYPNRIVPRKRKFTEKEDLKEVGGGLGCNKSKERRISGKYPNHSDSKTPSLEENKSDIEVLGNVKKMKLKIEGGPGIRGDYLGKKVVEQKTGGQPIGLNSKLGVESEETGLEDGMGSQGNSLNQRRCSVDIDPLKGLKRLWTRPDSGLVASHQLRKKDLE